MEIVKAVIPAARAGTTFLPFTKTIPQEMLPLLNKPAIQYVAEECLKAGIQHFSMATNPHKHAIADHFDHSTHAQNWVHKQANAEFLASISKLARLADFSYIRQTESADLGQAIWSSRHVIGKEYFSIALPDDIIISKQPALSQLMRIARQEKASIIAVQEVPTEYLSQYTVVAIKKQITPNLFQLSSVIEKPHPKDTPSSLAVVGRFVLSHKFFNSLEAVHSYTTGELQFSEALSHLMQHNERVFAYKIQGTRYDIRSPLGWIKAVIGSALQDPDYQPHIRKFLQEINTTESFLYNPAKTIEHYL